MVLEEYQRFSSRFAMELQANESGDHYYLNDDVKIITSQSIVSLSFGGK
jgi:hypothetical protein